MNIKEGDRIVFRYNDPSIKPTPHEWYDFKDEFDSFTGGCYDTQQVFGIFKGSGLVLRIVPYKKTIAYVVKSDNFGELTVTSKMIKKIESKPAFKITSDRTIVRC